MIPTFDQATSVGCSEFNRQPSEALFQLHNAHRLIENPGATAFVVSTKGCVAAFESIAPKAIATCASNAPEATDWTPLAERRVLIWLLHGDSGMTTAKAIGDLALNAGAKRVAIFNAGRLARDAFGLSEGWGVSDFVADGGTAAELSELMQNDPEFLIEYQSRGDSIPQAQIRKGDTSPPARPPKSIAARVPVAVCDDSEEIPIWESPVLFGEIDTPEIPATLLPTWLGSFAQAVSENTQTVPGMSVMTALSIVATCLQKRYVVSPYGDDYIEPVNLWTLTALPPGSRKTAVVNAFTHPITQWEEGQAQDLKANIELWKTRQAVADQRISDLQRSAAKKESAAERDDHR